MRNSCLILLCGLAILALHLIALSTALPEDHEDRLSKENDECAKKAAIRLLEQTRSKIENLKTLKAEFTQEKHLSMLTEPVFSKGEFKYGSGRRFVWHYLPPDESITISDGKKIWLYFPALKQLEVYDTEKFKTKSRAFEKLCLGFEKPLCDLTDTFSIELISETEDSFEIVLKPREESLSRMISDLKILVSKETGLPLRIKSLEPNGDRTTIEFSKMVLNPDLPDSTFSFCTPEGVTIDEKKNTLSY
ncbi:MAG: outer membrane lipoprotein carrier protein LolA [Candidatus Coatesbacteria bacterium]|nr:outer membrane lipoprotein carrier protein LolA [Candidatus Coatesbacteria bacterium]